MGKRIISILLISAVLILGGCSSGKNSGSSGSAADYKLAASEGKGNSGTEVKASDSAQSAAERTDEGERKVILNANANIQVKELKSSYSSVVERAKAIGGYVSNSTVNETSSLVTVRIPSQRMDEFLKFLATVGEIKDTSTSASDITEQYTDSASRLKSYKSEEEQLLQIMKKAQTVEDILKVQSQLTQIRGEIEALQGKINMWDKLVELSTVEVRMTKAPEISGKNVRLSFIGWSEVTRGMSNGFKRTLNSVVRFFGGLLVFLVSAVPVVPFILLAAWLIIRYWKKKKRIAGNR